MKSKRLIIAGFTALLCASVQAQTDNREVLTSFSFIEAQGGIQLTSTNAPMDKLITPTAAFSVGHYFTPVVGARLHVNAWQAKGHFADLGKDYKWKYVTPSLDLLCNLTRLFDKSPRDHALNVILLGGVGLNYAWDNDELDALGVAPQRVPLKWDDNRLSHNLRAGLRLETNQSKPLGLSLEVNANSLSDRFNSKTNDADDWQFQAMLGVSWRFGHRYKKPTPTYVPLVQEGVETQQAETAPAPVVVEEKKEPEKVAREVVKTEPVKLHREAFYAIRVSDNETPSAVLKDVADFMKTYKDVKVVVVGYADKGTGNARINLGYSQKRAEKFKADLVSRYGVDASRITVDAKGDSVQPFAENDKNRCVIVDATGVKEVKVTVYE